MTLSDKEKKQERRICVQEEGLSFKSGSWRWTDREDNI